MLTRSAIKRWYLVHKWTSLVCTAFMLLLCLTGLPLIFADEIDRALGLTLSPSPLPQTAGRADLDDIIAAARQRRPGDAVQFIVADPDEPNAWFVRMAKTTAADEPSAFYAFDARTGGYLYEYPLDQGVMNVVLRLHVDLFAGLPGMLLLGFMGLLLVVSLVSGVVLYGPFMRKLAFGTVRHRQSPRLKWLDLHNLFSIATLAWLLVVGITGVINTLAVPIFSQWQSGQLAGMLEPYRDRPPLQQVVSVQKALLAAYAAAPDMSLSFIAFPGNHFAGPQHFVAFMQGGSPLTARLLKPVLIDAQTGSAVATAELPLYVKALLLSKPLHFGDYGGLPLKLVWALLDMLSIAVLGSGLYLWLKKRNVPFEARLGIARDEKSTKRLDSA
ncbi:MAG: PepSY domain-containing protein [Methylovulum sp.]|nr:MAG: PepSY domain-containing protein [Methylovulum sp.]